MNLNSYLIYTEHKETALKSNLPDITVRYYNKQLRLPFASVQFQFELSIFEFCLLLDEVLHGVTKVARCQHLDVAQAQSGY